MPKFLRPRTSPIFWLLSGQLIMFTGYAAIFPIAPLYVRRHGGSSLAIALFIAAPFIANMLVQVPAGRLTDRIGRRPMLLGSRAVFAVLAFALFADIGPLWLLAVLRTLQGPPPGPTSPRSAPPSSTSALPSSAVSDSRSCRRARWWGC